MKKWIAITCMTAFLGNQASAISFNAATDGDTPPAGATFTSSTGSLTLRTADGWTVLGTSAGELQGQIREGESLQIDFAAPEIFTQLTLGRLFDGPEHDDVVEIAAAILNGGVTPFFLKATGTTTASWSGSGTVMNLAPASPGEAAVWQITNPFGNTQVTSLFLYPEPNPDSPVESDFGLVSFDTRVADVPEPVTALASLVTVGGLMFLRRKRVA